MLSCVHCRPQSACLVQKGCSQRWFCILRFWLWLWQLPYLAGTAGHRGKADQSSGEAGAQCRSTVESRATHRSPAASWQLSSDFSLQVCLNPKKGAMCSRKLHTNFLQMQFFFVKNGLLLRRNSKSHLGELCARFPCNANLSPAQFGRAGRTVNLSLCSLGLSDLRRNSQICYVKGMSSGLVFRMQLYASIE